MFTAAVVGPPLDKEPDALLLFDALPDMLTDFRDKFRLLVPVAVGTLTEGVQAVVEWAWEMGGVDVVAVYDGHSLGDDMGRGFLEEDADEVISADDVVDAMVSELAEARPTSALICALYDAEPDDFTQQVMRGCFELKVPVYDVSHGMIELSIHDLDGWDDAPAPEPPAEETEPAETEAVADAAPEPGQMADTAALDAECTPPAAGLDALRAALREARKEHVAAITRSRRIIEHINAALGEETEPEPRHGIEISYDGEQGPWHPRKRGRAPGGSIERDAVTKMILRRN